jgi:hypothetical protein
MDTTAENTDRLTESLAAEAEDDDGNGPVPRAPRPRAANSARVKFVPESPSEEEDADFSDSELPELLDVSDSEDEYDSDVDNDEVRAYWLSILNFELIVFV